MELPRYRLLKPAKYEELIIHPSVKGIRPYVVACVLRGLSFNSVNFNSFIDLQEKLHQNICRQRTLVSIGTHDLDTIKGPFVYMAKPPSEIKFVPLYQTQELDGHALMVSFILFFKILFINFFIGQFRKSFTIKKIFTYYKRFTIISCYL